jgi:serine phosphatase RsbU (regulator of sigma subunit)
MSVPKEPARTVQFSIRHVEPPKVAHYLTVVQGVTIQRAVPLAAAPLVIGRDPGRAFFLSDEDVSRSHCEVRLAGDVVLVRDLGSTNGTFVDGVRVEGERPLPVSSLLQVGRHALKHELLRPEEVDRHRQFAGELESARRYVQALIPGPISSGPLRTEWCFVPCSVLGGDALGYHELEGGRFAFYVLDVCGHGVASAMHSASVLNAVRGQTLPGADFARPAQVLERLNQTFRMEDHGGMYFTFFYGVLDPAGQRLRYASAGHPPAIVLGGEGRIERRLATKNPPIGTLADRKFAEAEAEFRRGERLYVFSDGVYEIRDAQGRERALEDFERELVASATPRRAGDPLRLHAAACSASGATLLPDDFTLLVVEHAPGADSGPSN